MDSVSEEYAKLMQDGNLGSDFEDEDDENQVMSHDEMRGVDGLMSRHHGKFGPETSSSSRVVPPVIKKEEDVPENYNFAVLEGKPDSETELYKLDIIPEKYRCIFSEYNYFNIVQSSVIPAIFSGNSSIGVCAPTGSGKTVIFELAIIHLLASYEKSNAGLGFSGKIIYMSPLKAICNEKFKEWRQRFSGLNIDICQVTGDTEKDDLPKVHKSHLIITTPEKWDSMTRRISRDNSNHLMMSVKLVLIDEVHLVSDQQRGSCLEAVVTRIKMMSRKQSSDTPSDIRFIAVSATAPNIQDVALWLGSDQNPGLPFSLSADYRPVKLNTHVIGYPSYDHQNEYQFDANLNFKVAEVISRYSKGRPSLVFCMTRKGVVDCAKRVAEKTPYPHDSDLQNQLSLLTDGIRDQNLRDLLQKGIAYHHSGVESMDRQLVEDGFRRGIITSLFSTSSLSMGVNLPAHLVIIKGTKRFIQGNVTEYDESEILQMIGRAGRPQFDESGVAVIMTRDKDRQKFERLIRGERLLESSLHLNLAEHLNAEIVLKTITDVTVALKWLKSTFFYIRCLKNPTYYGMDAGSTDEKIDVRLKNMCIRELNGLKKYTMITMDGYGCDVRPTPVGTLMAHFCISYETMKSFVELKPRTFLKELLLAICGSKELKQDIQLRTEDKKYIWSFHNGKDTHVPTVRFPNPEKIKTVEQKINTLLQIEFGSFQDEGLQKYRMDINRLLKVGSRITGCLAEYMALEDVARVKGFTTVRNSVTLAKSFKRGLWENSVHVMKQMPGVGPKISRDLVSKGISSFQSLETKDPRELEGIVNRHAPFGNNLLQFSKSIPKYRIQVYQKAFGTDAEKLSIEVMVTLENLDDTRRHKNSGWKQNSFSLIIADSGDNLLMHNRIKDEQLIRDTAVSRIIFIKKKENLEFHQLLVSLISDSWVGVDLPRVEFNIQTSDDSENKSPEIPPLVRSENVPHPSILMSSTPGPSMTRGSGDQKMTRDDRKECSHTCRDKNACRHNCCKHGLKTRKTKSRSPHTRSTSNLTLAASNVTRQLQFIQESKSKYGQSGESLVAHSSVTGDRIDSDDKSVPHDDIGF